MRVRRILTWAQGRSTSVYLDDEIDFGVLKGFVGRQDAESVRASKELLERGDEIADDLAELR